VYIAQGERGRHGGVYLWITREGGASLLMPLAKIIAELLSTNDAFLASEGGRQASLEAQGVKGGDMIRSGLTHEL